MQYQNSLLMNNRLQSLIIGAAICCAPAAVFSQTYYDLAGDADAAIAEGRWKDAATALEEAMKLRPDNPSNILLMSNLGIIYYNLGEDSLALATLNRANSLAPKSVTVLINRADVLLSMQRENEAYEDLTKIISLDSALVEPLYDHAMLSLRRGDTAQALADCNRLKEIAPEKIETFIANGSYYSAIEQWIDAIPYYTTALEMNPSSKIYCARAVCYLMLQRLGEASADITSGLELDPNDKELYLYRAYLNKMRYLTDDARRDLLKALQ